MLKAQNTEQRRFKPVDTKGKDINDEDSNTNFSISSSHEGRDLTVDGAKTPDNKLPLVLKTKSLGGYASAGPGAEEFSKNNAVKRVEESYHREGKVNRRQKRFIMNLKFLSLHSVKF